jgi:hypothetical protein
MLAAQSCRSPQVHAAISPLDAVYKFGQVQLLAQALYLGFRRCKLTAQLINAHAQSSHSRLDTPCNEFM